MYTVEGKVREKNFPHIALNPVVSILLAVLLELILFLLARVA